MAIPAWLEIAAELAPVILKFTPLAPIADSVARALALAEQIPGASGPQKKEIVQGIVGVAAEGANAQAGKVVIDPVAAATVAPGVIDTIVGVVNTIRDNHQPSPSA